MTSNIVEMLEKENNGEAAISGSIGAVAGASAIADIKRKSRHKEVDEMFMNGIRDKLEGIGHKGYKELDDDKLLKSLFTDKLYETPVTKEKIMNLIKRKGERTRMSKIIKAKLGAGALGMGGAGYFLSKEAREVKKKTTEDRKFGIGQGAVGFGAGLSAFAARDMISDAKTHAEVGEQHLSNLNSAVDKLQELKQKNSKEINVLTYQKRDIKVKEGEKNMKELLNILDTHDRRVLYPSLKTSLKGGSGLAIMGLGANAILSKNKKDK